MYKTIIHDDIVYSLKTRHSSATIMLHELHWLPIKKRAIYKLLLMVYKSQQDMMPDYITSHRI